MLTINNLNSNSKLTAPKLVTALHEQIGKVVSTETVCRALKKMGYYSWIVRSKLFITGSTRKERLEFARKYQFAEIDESGVNDENLKRGQGIVMNLNLQISENSFERITPLYF